MNQILRLLSPRILSFRHRGLEPGGWVRLLFFGAIGLGFWTGIFAISYRMLSYFQGIPGFGDIPARKLLSMVLVTFFSLLMFSAVLTSLSKLYLSRDLYLVHALPVSREKIFLARWIESTVDSAWMVLVYTVPILIAYGWVYRAGPFFYLDMGLVLLPLCVVASSVSALVVLLVVMILPANRIRSIFVFLGLAVLILLYLTFRMLRPERLVNPEAFSSVMVYLRDMGTPSSPLLPSTWAYDSLEAALAGDRLQSLLHAALSWSGAGFSIFVTTVVARWVYFRGFSKSQAAMIRLFRTRDRWTTRLFRFLPTPVRAFVVKEIKTFWRDQTQWSQLFLIAALIVIYLYNFSVLPLEVSPIRTVYLQNLFSFLNMALAAFVLTAVAARFTFPSVSQEGSAFWIVRSSPISIRGYLRIKFWIYLCPLLVLSQILIVATNVLLQVTPLMMGISVVTMLFMAPAVVAMGVGLGAAYPDFGSENPAQSVTSFGGLVFMILSAAYIGTVTLLEAGPVYHFFMAQVRGGRLSHLHWLWAAMSFTLASLISVAAVVWPLRFGARRLAGGIPAGATPRTVDDRSVSQYPLADERLSPNPRRQASNDTTT